MRRTDLALVGFGHVGRRFALLLDGCRPRLLRDHQLDCRIIGIATGTHGSIFDSQGVDGREAAFRRAAGHALGPNTTATDVIAQLGASSADLRVVIETTTLGIVDGRPSISHVEAAFDAGCHVVTANKGPAAFAYRRLKELADRAKLSFLFEGAVMDGVPIFNLVRETMPAVTISGFRGIINTTTHHILNAIEDGEPFASALARMQAQGIAEADPSLDVDGWDAAAKVAVMANVFLDADITPHGVEREPLGPATARAAQAAKAAGRRLRLVASALRANDGVRAGVRLIEIDSEDLLATLPNTANALVLTTDLLEDVAVCQMSGNLTQTAYALLSDLVTVSRRTAGARS